MVPLLSASNTAKSCNDANITQKKEYIKYYGFIHESYDKDIYFLIFKLINNNLYLNMHSYIYMYIYIYLITSSGKSAKLKPISIILRLKAVLVSETFVSPTIIMMKLMNNNINEQHLRLFKCFTHVLSTMTKDTI